MPYHRKQSNGHNYTKKEKQTIKELYAIANKGESKNGWLEKLANQLNRSKPNISRFARSMGWTDRKRKKNTNGRTLTKRICRVCKKSFYHTRGVYKTLCNKTCHNKWHLNRWSYDPHPRGMLGKKQSSSHIETLRRATIERWKDPNSIFNSQKHRQMLSNKQTKQNIMRIKNEPNSVYSRTTKGWMEYKDGRKYFMRSKWEMNYSCYLEFLKKHKQIKDWTYEEDTFWFEKIKRGVRSYTPDFKIINNDNTIEYHEVKGWMDDKSKTKLKRMKIYYKNIVLKVIQEAEYKNIGLNKALYKGWQ